MLTPYPESVPIDAVDSIIGMIKDKNVDKGALGLAIWNVQGYVQSLLLSIPSIKSESYSHVPDQLITDDEAAQALTQLKASQGPLASAGAFALSLLLKWLLNKALEHLSNG